MSLKIELGGQWGLGACAHLMSQFSELLLSWWPVAKGQTINILYGGLLHGHTQTLPSPTMATRPPISFTLKGATPFNLASKRHVCKESKWELHLCFCFYKLCLFLFSLYHNSGAYLNLFCTGLLSPTSLFPAQINAFYILLHPEPFFWLLV